MRVLRLEVSKDCIVIVREFRLVTVCWVEGYLCIAGRMPPAEKKEIQAGWKREWERIQADRRRKAGLLNAEA